MCPNYFWPKQIGDTVLQTGAQEHSGYVRGGSDIWFIHSSWLCGMKSDSSFQVAEHGYLIDHANSITKLTTPTACDGGF